MRTVIRVAWARVTSLTDDPTIMDKWAYTKAEIESQANVLASGMNPLQMMRELMRCDVMNYADYQIVMQCPDNRSRNSKLLDLLFQRDPETALPALTQSLRLLHPKLADKLRPAPTCVVWLVSTPSLAAHVVHCLPPSVAFNDRVETGAGYLYRQAFLSTEGGEDGKDNTILLYLVFPYDPTSQEAASKALTAALTTRFESRDLVVMSGTCTSETTDVGCVIITAPFPFGQATPPITEKLNKALETLAGCDGTVMNKKPLTAQWEWEKSVMVRCEGVIKGPGDIDTAMENSTHLLFKIISNL